MAKEGLGTRSILAAIEGFRSVSDGFTKSFDSYKEKHEKSETEDGWVEDFPKNVWNSMDDMLKGVANAPGKVVDRFLEEKDSETK